METFTAKHSGQQRKVLFEGNVKTGMMEGYTDNYIKISMPFNAEWVNQEINCTI
jgi:threonylcarbamoyladenosine tRNA methylthiotransferase MtaB